MSIAAFIGVVLGVIAGYFGGWVDLALSRLTEIIMCFPTFFVIIAVISFVEPWTHRVRRRTCSAKTRIPRWRAACRATRR